MIIGISDTLLNNESIWTHINICIQSNKNKKSIFSKKSLILNSFIKKKDTKEIMKTGQSIFKKLRSIANL